MIRRNSLAFRTLVTMARQRPEFNELRCHALLDILAVTDEIRLQVHHELQDIYLSEARISVLIALLASDPEPVLPARLTEQIGVTPGAITVAIDHLEDLALIERRRGRMDRRNRPVSLLKSGRELAEKATVLVLRALDRIGRPLEDADPGALLVLCEKLMGMPDDPVSDPGPIKPRNGRAGRAPVASIINNKPASPQARSTQSQVRYSETVLVAQPKRATGSNPRTDFSEARIPQCVG